MWVFTCALVAHSLYLVSSQAGIYDCPDPWLEFEDNCYWFILFEKNINDARQDCDDNGAALVSVNSPDENDFITNWLSANALQNRKWYTSGSRRFGDENVFEWEDGNVVEGAQFWLDEDARKMEGDQILYATYGQAWGWMMGKTQEANQEIMRPFICEISKSQVSRIVDGDRGFDYGIQETDPSKLERGPFFIEQPEDVIFDETSNYEYLTIECVADGNPQPSFEWYKSRQQRFVAIDPLADDRFTITNGRLALNNPDDTVGDNGEYQCRASNKFGTILSNAVTVSFGYLNDFPKSSRDPVSVESFQGTGIECNPPTHGYPRLYYQWLKDGQFIYPERKPYIFISLNGKLYFSSVTRDDVGEYQCIITVPESLYSHNGGKTSQPIELTVIEGVGSERPPQIESGFPAVFPSSPTIGTDVTIECFARGYSSQIDGLQYSWEKVGGVIPDNAQYRDFKRVLYLPNIQIINAGEYRCTVTIVQSSGQTSASVNVKVEAEPYFTIPLKDQHVDIGADLVWQCIADGLPAVSYKWAKNGMEIVVDELPEDDRVRYEINNNVLTIREANLRRDPGMYQCIATNTRATRYSSAQLRVLQFAPTFAKYPLQKRTYATLEGSVSLICQPEAAPTASKIWYKDNRIVTESFNEFDRIHILPNGNLRITNLNMADAGMYKCAASNDLGEAESEGELTILPTTRISNPPQDMVVKVNHTAFFHCEASFNPALDITYDWYHNDYHIQFLKIRIIGEVPYIEKEDYFERGTGINKGGLYIRDVQYFHKGRYTCIAKTTTDSITNDAKLDVIGPPFPPVGIIIDQVTPESCRVTWKMSNLAANGKEVTSYIVEKKHVHDTEWRRAKGHLVGLEVQNRQTTIVGLTPASTYQFRVRAENSLGIGDPSMESDSVTTLEAPPVTAPTYVGRCINKVGTLCITWSPVPLAERNGDGFGYMVQFKKSTFIDEQWSIVNVTAEETTYVATVGQSNFYREYDVQIRTMNRRGSGPASQQVTIYSAMDIPSGQATQLRIWQHNATALLAEWDPVDNIREQMKGILKGYRINYWRTCCESEEMAIFNQVEGQTDSGMIIGLYPDTEYEVNVQVYNEAGYGPKTDPLIQETLRAAPMEAPQEVKVYVAGSRSVRVTFRGVSTTINEEPLEGYIIRFWRQSENRYMSQDVDTLKKTDYTVRGLHVNTMYELRVLGYSRGGDGLMSSPIIQFILGENCWVREDSPDTDYVYKCKGETGAAPTLHISITTLFITALLHRLISLL